MAKCALNSETVSEIKGVGQTTVPVLEFDSGILPQHIWNLKDFLPCTFQPKVR